MHIHYPNIINNAWIMSQHNSHLYNKRGMRGYTLQLKGFLLCILYTTFKKPSSTGRKSYRLVWWFMAIPQAVPSCSQQFVADNPLKGFIFSGQDDDISISYLSCLVINFAWYRNRVWNMIAWFSLNLFCWLWYDETIIVIVCYSNECIILCPLFPKSTHNRIFVKQQWYKL